MVLFSRFAIHPKPKELFIFQKSEKPFQVVDKIMHIVFGKVEEQGYFRFSSFNPFEGNIHCISTDDVRAPLALLHANEAIANHIKQGLLFWMVRPITKQS